MQRQSNQGRASGALANFQHKPERVVRFVAGRWGIGQGGQPKRPPFLGCGLKTHDFPAAASGQSHRDSYRVGLIWSIVKCAGIGNDGVCESDIWDEGLAWSTNEAESDAIAAIAAIQQLHV
ncbi:hypothetical protein SHAM105786_16155 [Shewanella amazonensis]